MNSTSIKNLAIALEALSRIPESKYFSTRIEALLGHELDYAKQLQEERLKREQDRTPIKPDDEIHF